MMVLSSICLMTNQQYACKMLYYVILSVAEKTPDNDFHAVCMTKSLKTAISQKSSLFIKCVGNKVKSECE